MAPMSTLFYHLKLKPGYKLSDKERIRLSVKKVRKLLAETEVDNTVVGFYHRYGVTVFVHAHSDPDEIHTQFAEAKARIGSTCPKLHHTTVGP